jgi:hypothetical protein
MGLQNPPVIPLTWGALAGSCQSKLSRIAAKAEANDEARPSKQQSATLWSGHVGHLWLGRVSLGLEELLK